MNEYDNIIQSYTEAGPAQATTAIGADPERATRALQLSRATGVPPLAVHNDLDRFEEDHKANLTANIVRGNSQISSYIRGNALADHVSNDDYGNLDESSRAFTDALDSHPIWGKGIPKQYIAEPLMEGLKGAIYGAAEGFTQEPFKVPENYSALSKGAYDFLGIPLRGLNAVAGGFMGGAGGLARQATIALGGDENQAARAEREARGIVESEMGRGGSGLQHADHAIGQVVRQNEALAVAKPWLDAGVDVPRGVHPLIDEIKVKTNDAWVDKIQTALDQAQNSLTKERDPELFKNFAQQHFEDAQMGISGDRVAALYGDKLPEPGDGLLGWVPGIAEKLEAARTFGEDVHVPLADWVTYMDPGLARELKDDIRAWPGGITKNEAALKDVAAPAIGANKEMTPVKEAVPEIEPRTLDERLDAYREEYRNMPEDATFDERGFRQSGLRDALATVSSSFGVSGDRGREALDLAIRHDRPDIAEALVQRAERLAQKSDTTPGVPETSPKYNEIKKNLERIKKEAEDYAAELREKLNEAKLKNDTLIDGALPQVRTSAALEPMFAIGDRPLKLEKLESKYKQMEEYNFVDHTGKVIGDITIFPDPLKKQLYIASVASHDLQPNTMGPSLVRDIKRQLKELYPDYETVTGYRISGAREEAGAPKDQRKPVVKLALGDAFEMSKEYTDLRNILDTAPTKFGDVTADIKPTELYSKHEQAFLQAGQEELNRITGKTAKLILASNIRYEGIDDIRGVYHKMPGEVAKIIISALDFDKGGILRHEAIHHLYREGFFKPEEWNALIEASKAEGWRERYDIDARYEHLNELGLHEEAIAEAFRDWAKTREQQPINPVTTVFQKIWDLMQRIKDRVAEILGREPTFNELFEQAYSGELAQRQSGVGTAGSAMGLAAKPFYSAVQKIVDSGKLIKGTADQWLGMLKNTAGIKPEEMKWLGLENWLREQKGSVTKEQVSEYVRANQLQVNEVVKGALPRVDEAAIEAASHQAQQAYADFTLALDEKFPDGFKVHDEVVPSDAIAYRLTQGEMSYTELPKDIQPLAETLIASDVAYYDAADVSRPKEETKYDRYKLHGGDNYRELLLTLPEKGEGKRTPGWGADAEWHDKNFESSHWDEANVLAHVRYDERIGPNGERILHIAEIQSDWHQEGRKRGYKDLSSAEEANGYRVADAPLKNSWPEFAMKRMIRMAAENGFDKISWDTGKTNADRYGLRKELSRIVLSDNSSGGVGKPSMEGPFQGGLLKAYDKRGREVVNRWIEDEASLADHIGQEVAKKLLSAEPKESYDSGMGGRRRSLEDAELDVGGEGMKGFYDKILPETVNKLVKKYGAKVESGKVETTKEFIRDPEFGNYHEEMQYADVHQFDLTDKLKEIAVEQGFPAFAKGEIENYLKAEAAGLDAKSFKRIQDLIQKRYQEDIAAAVKRAEQEQRTIQSKEWKEQAREVRKESEADVRARPDVQADLLIGSGELGGKKLERNRYELRSEDLSPEQKANLPRHYYAKDGVPVDVMANLFGYSDGNHLIEALAEVNKGKEGRSAQENLKRLIDEETNRRMEEKYGKLQQNIMLDAMDQALSETNLQILSEEWQGAAMAAGVKVVDKNVAKAEVMRMFDNMKMSDINVERLLGIMGKVGRDTERALIAGKNAEALVLMQRKYQTALLAAEARKIQKEQASAEKTFKTLSKREVTSMEPEYTDYAHQIMMQIGKPVRRSIQDLQEALARHDGQGNLKDFVERKQQDFRAIDAWDQLYDASWRKDYSELTTSEFRAIHDTIKTLVHNGREERKIYKAGEAADWADLKTEFVDSIQTAAHNKLAKVGKGKKSLLPDQYFTGVVQMETFLNRLDGYNPRNNWFQYVFRGLADGTAQFDKWKKDYAKKISALPSPDNLGRTIDNPLFKNQKNDMPLTFTRRDLIGVMLNTGNDTNLVKLAHGYKLKSDDVMAWVHQHATKQDWDFVQGIWDIFKEIKRDTDTMYRSLSGVAPENIPIRPVDTPHGQFAGGYYPLIRHPEFGDVATKRFKDVLAQENWVNTLPAAGHTKLRTGAIYPLATNLDYMVGHMNQMLFDNAMRPAIIQASKVFHDKAISNAVYKYFGQAWEGELHDYIVGVANSQNYMAKNMQGFAWLSESLRQNMIGNVVGLNPSTPMKHGPTALVLSMKEVGPMEFAKAVRMMHSVNETTGAKWVKFVDENSLEIQRRDRNWQETLFGGVASHDPTNAVEYYRQKMIQFASKPVAWSDMASARPTWLAAYMKAMEEGSDHGEAVALGDRAIRRAHGSTASTSRTAVQRNWNPWFVSIYNFWSDILNRQIETVWKAGDMYKLTEGNPVQKGLATAPTILGGAFAYVIWPMIVENIVSPHPHKDDESWASKAGKSLMFTLSGGWPILRDIGSAMAMGRDPQMGFTGTALSTGYNVIRDFMKNEPFNKEHAGRLIQDWASVVGAITGGPGVQLGRVLRFGLDTYTGKENPKNAWQWAVGLRYGTTNKHSQSWDDYWKGKH